MISLLAAAAAVGLDQPEISVGIAQQTTISCQFGKPGTNPSDVTDILGIFLPTGLTNESLTRAEVADPTGLLSGGSFDRFLSKSASGSIHLTTAGIFRMLLTIMPKESAFRVNALLGPLDYFSKVDENSDKNRKGICRIIDGVGARAAYDQLKSKSAGHGQ